MNNSRILWRTILFLFITFSTSLTACSSGGSDQVDPNPEKPKPEETEKLNLNIASYNIRMQTSADQGDKAWENRKQWANAIVKKHDFDIFGTQEGFQNQLIDMLADNTYAYIGVGRDDGKNKGEHSAIHYKKDRFEVLDKGDFWLSETPDIPSTGWDANVKRICSWGKFRDKKTKKEFFVMNAHYDHQAKIARYESSKLVLSKIKSIAGDTPIFFMGDLNAESTENSIETLSSSGVLWDSRHSSVKPIYGTEGTYHGYKLDGKTQTRIDYIFVSKTIRVKQYGVINDDIATGKFSSDHFPILVNAEL